MDLKTWMKRMDTFFDFTSMIGFRFMHSRHALWFRLIAVLLIVASLGLSVYQSTDRLVTFINNPIVINIDQNDANRQQLPLVYICSDSQYQSFTDPSLPLDVMLLLQYSTNPDDYEKLNKAHEELPKLTAIRQQLVNISSENFKAHREDFLAQLNETSKRIVEYLPTIGVRLDLQPLQYLTKIDQNMTMRPNFNTFMQMQTRWDECWRKNLPNKTSTNSTKINANYATVLCEVDKAIQQLLMVQNLNWTALMISAEGSNKEILIDCKWMGQPCHIKSAWTSRGKCFQISAPSVDLQIANVTGNKAAITIMVHTRPLETDSVVQLVLQNLINKTDTALFGDAHDVQAGSAATFSISRVTQMERYGRNCGTRQLTKFSNYSHEACLWEQTDEAITNLCHCRWYFSPDNRNTTGLKLATTKNSTYDDCNITQHFSCVEDAVIDPKYCPDDCYETVYEVDRMNYPLADNVADLLPQNWTSYVDTAISRYANQSRLENLVTNTELKLKSMVNDLFSLYMELFFEFWNDESCTSLILDDCLSRGKPFIPFWMSEADEIEKTLTVSLFNKYPVDYFAYHKPPTKTPCDYVQDVNSTLIPDDLLGVLSHYNNTLTMKLEANNSTDAVIEVVLSTYDQLIAAAASTPMNGTVQAASEILQLLKDDIANMEMMCINSTNITDYHYCFYFYNSEVLRMTLPEDVASFNQMVAANARKPGAYNTLQKQFRLYSTLGLPTVLAAAQLKKNFMISREAFEAKNSWQTAINPFLDWLTNELYITRTCPSVIEICTNVKQRASDVNLASTLTFNASAINLADFVRFYSIVPNYQVLETMITNLSANLTALKSSYTDFISSLRWSLEDKFGIVLTEKVDDQELENLLNCTSKQLNAVQRLLSTKVITANDADGTTWLSTFYDLLNSDAMGVYRRGTPYIQKSIATININYRSFSVQNIVQTSTYTVWTFLSDIGGTMGLYLGATLLTFFELIAFFVHGEETIAKANWEARLRTPAGPRPDSVGQISTQWEPVGSHKFVQFVHPSTIDRSVAKVASS